MAVVNVNITLLCAGANRLGGIYLFVSLDILVYMNRGTMTRNFFVHIEFQQLQKAMAMCE